MGSKNVYMASNAPEKAVDEELAAATSGKQDLRLRPSMLTRATSLAHGLAGWKMENWKSLLPVISTHEQSYKGLSDREIRKQSLALRYRARSGESLARLLPESYALVRVASERVLGMRHYDVQMLGGIALFKGAIAEMETGEGKTLTATLPVYLRALMGHGSHLATVNDYLAARDAEEMAPIYEALGLTIGVIQTDDSRDQRREAYHCDITYGTAKEFGFDFLRDRLLLRRMGRQLSEFLGEGSSQRWEEAGDKPVQRESYYCVVDEADSILIDEARTPLIIGSIGEDAVEQITQTYAWSAHHASLYEENDDYEYDHEKRKVELTYAGRQRVRALPKPDLVSDMGLVDLYEYSERAVKVFRDFHLDQHYVVVDGEITIVDESTGRLAEGRKWRDGIHQAIEAKENVEITVATGQAARITIQDLFLRYRYLGGMTGTARSATREFRKVYKLNVIQIPTNRPNQRKQWQDEVSGNADAKWAAIVDEVRRVHEEGRPVLIGTRSIEKSETLSRQLDDAGINHQVLNAHEVEREADIVAQAGHGGKVTVATNMAGRGTDIKLSDGVADIGGLHVICTELHDSARIDRQLIGRCARQGDPGSFRQFMSLDDDVLREAHGREKSERIAKQGEERDRVSPQFASQTRKAQAKVEKKHYRDRATMLHHEKERKKIQREIGQDPYLDSAD